MPLATFSRRLTAADADRPAPAVRWRAPFAPTPRALQATESDPGKSVIAARGSRIRVGIGRMDSRLRGNNGSCRNHGLVDGIIPAIAGMTVKNAVDVIPAKAGVHGFSDQCSSQTRTPNTDEGPRMAVGRRLGGFALAALVTAGVLPGCTVTESAVLGVAAVSLNQENEAPPSDDALNGEVLYKLLVGELASHRGDMLVALENYLEVARETRDARRRGAGDQARDVRSRREARSRGGAPVDRRRSVECRGPAGARVPAHPGRGNRRGGRAPRQYRGRWCPNRGVPDIIASPKFSAPRRTRRPRLR